MFKTVAALCGTLLVAGVGTANAGSIRGEYVEARTADVFTGPCFSNAEVFIYGDQAVMAWRVTEGSWQGVDLAGLSVAAAVQASNTFSTDRPEESRSVLIVDQKASPEQRSALIAMAKELGGARLRNVVAVRDSVINLTIESHATTDAPAEHSAHAIPQAPRAAFWAPGLAEITTRPMDADDHRCGNEVVAYPPLSKGVDALPAYTLGHAFRGAGLGGNWDDPNCRSSFVGHFAL